MHILFQFLWNKKQNPVIYLQSILNYCKKSSKCQYYEQGSGYTPKRGDIIFYTWDHRQSVGHVGIVTEVHSNNRFKFIHASTNNGVIISSSTLNVSPGI